MIHQRTQLIVSVFAAMILVAAATHADDSVEPEPVLMTENPLTTEQAQSVQKAWAEHLGFEAAFENSIGMQLRVIPPGSFRMSSPQAEEGQRGPVDATLSQAFLIGQFEVTQGEWERVMGPIEGKLDAGAGDRFPVYRVNHAEATEFCGKLTQLDRKAGKLPVGYEYRLPTAAEWGFACRAGTLTHTHFGDKMNSRMANYDGTRPFRDSEKGPNLGRAAEVGSYPANAWGVHDMLGNLAEWCMDWYHRKVEGGVDPVQLQPFDLEKPRMVGRGSSWKSPGRYCHSANRYFSPPESRNSHIGFRPVLTKIRHVATGQANSTQADTTSAANLVAAATHAGDSDGPEPVLMTEHPLTAEQAQAAQKAWARHLRVDAVVENSIGMQLCVIPPGTFPMGSPRGEANRKGGEELQQVTHTQPFFIGRYEVTQAGWERVVGKIKEPGQFGSGDRFPIYQINHAEASEFCRKLTQLDREADKLPEGYEYRLPTDAEWEYACRAGTLTATYFGDKVSSRQANFNGSQPYNGAEKGPNLGRTAEVGSYPANAWGLHDMHGNLCEWCLDWYHERAKGGVDPVQLTPAPKRLIRDARHGNPGFYCRSANRYYAPAKQRRTTVGFRPVLTMLHLGH